ncbi:hypothetical protein [Streptomyces sp. NPDC050504]|uniref:hypothetical protein n=1 Tax=Streptomyces sp. NPDC050504 TaxID=3365618 RepID=UPI0037BC07C1
MSGLSIAMLLAVIGLVLTAAVLAAAAAGKLARLDGATYPTALTRAAAAFTAVLALSAVLTSTITQLFQ